MKKIYCSSNITKRRSIRKFKTKEIETKKLDAILQAAMFSPSARNTKKWELIVVNNQQKIKKLAQMKPHSIQAEKAPVVIVICSHNWTYWIEDAVIVAEHIWLEAVNQGLSSSMIQVRNSSTHSGENPEKYIRKILNIPDKIRIQCMMAIGYPDEELPVHSLEEVDNEKIHINKF